MVEVIFTWHGTYPFRGPKQSENTFMQVVKHDLTDDQITFQRQKGKIIKTITSPHFIKLIKTLKEDSKLHLVYEYEQVPLEEYIQNIKKSIEGTISKEKYKFLMLEFKRNIDNMMDVLINLQIKADVVICNIAVHSVNQEDGSLLLKTFLDPEAEYLSLIQHDYRAKETKKKDKSSINQEYLLEFYEAERKRLMLDFQQLLEKTFGKFSQDQQNKQFPNFVISGTKLVFVNCDEKQRENFTQKQGKNSKDSQNSKKGPLGVEAKQKLPLKPEQHKQEIQKSISSAPSPTIGRQSGFQKPIDRRPQSPIIDFDQSFEPEFKPEEFLKEKTYIYEERDYLDSLEQQLHHMQEEKQKEEKLEKKVIKQTPHTKKHDYASQKTEKMRPAKELAISQGSTQGNTYQNKLNQSNTSNNMSNNVSQNDSYDRKEQKMNKYKMKIITSHQIEVQGGVEEPNVQQIQKQIIEGIRSGKINIKELAAQKNPKVTVVSRNEGLEGSQNSLGLYQSDHREENKSSQYLGNIQKTHKSDKIRHESDGESKTSIKTREIQMSKMKNISQILEKIGVKYNTFSQASHQSSSQHSEPHNNNSLTVHSKLQSKKSGQPIMNAVSTPQSKSEKTEKSEKSEQWSHEYSDEKITKAENFINKIRDAKNKAQQVLKQYTKKKQ